MMTNENEMRNLCGSFILFRVIEAKTFVYIAKEYVVMMRFKRDKSNYIRRRRALV